MGACSSRSRSMRRIDVAPASDSDVDAPHDAAQSDTKGSAPPQPLKTTESWIGPLLLNSQGSLGKAKRGGEEPPTLWRDTDGSGRDLIGKLGGTPVHARQLSNTCALLDVKDDNNDTVHIMVRRRTMSRSDSESSNGQAMQQERLSFIVLPSP